jgi:hypothetical protein
MMYEHIVQAAKNAAELRHANGQPYHEDHRAAEAASADLLCCPPTHHYVGEAIHRRGKWGHITYIDPRTQSALVE